MYVQGRVSHSKGMAVGHLRNDDAEALRVEIRNSLPYGRDWLITPIASRRL
jgi:hypothetical protein